MQKQIRWKIWRMWWCFGFEKKTQLVLSSLEGNSPLPAINWMRVSKGEVFVAASWSRLSFEELKMHLVFLSQAFVRIFLWNLQDMPDGRNSLYRDWNKIYHVLVSSSQPLFDSIRVYTYRIYIYNVYDYIRLIVLYFVSMSWLLCTLGHPPSTFFAMNFSSAFLKRHRPMDPQAIHSRMPTRHVPNPATRTPWDEAYIFPACTI